MPGTAQSFSMNVLRGMTAAEWTSDNPLLLQFDLGVESDTGKAKLGDGVTRWASLDYFNPGGSSSGGPLVYRATLTQSGTDAPEATVLENTLGGTPVISTPGDPGTHQITLEGAWPAGKVFCTGGVFPTDAYLISWGVQRNSNDILSFNVQKIFDNGGFALTPINDWPCTISLEILVYP